jgi:thiamine kinase
MPPSTATTGDARALDAARRYVPGDGEPRVDAVGSGVANRTYSVIRGGTRYALRILGDGGRKLGVDRDWERRVLQKVAPAKLAPVVEACIPAEGVLVTRWVEGRFWSEDDAHRVGNLATVASLIRKIHSVRAPVMARAMTPARWIDLYCKALSQQGRRGQDIAVESLPALNAEVPQMQKAYERCGPQAATLCHSDLHRHNLIHSDEGIVVLDWEYAHVGDPFWDLAGWLSMNDLSADDADAILVAYLGRRPMDDERRRLLLLRWFYDFVALLWIRLYDAVRAAGDPAAGDPAAGDPAAGDPAAGDPADLRKRAGLLVSRLAPGLRSLP